MDSESESDVDAGVESDTSDYDDIRPFFHPEVFSKVPQLLKQSYRSKKERYEAMMIKGVPMKPPSFMASRGQDKVKRTTENSLDEGSSAGPSKRAKITRATTVRQSQRVPGHQKTPNDELLTSNEDSGAHVDNDFPGIRQYFYAGDWENMTPLVKNHASKSKEVYDDKLKRGLCPSKPKFMQQFEALQSKGTVDRSPQRHSSAAHTSSQHLPKSFEYQDFNIDETEEVLDDTDTNTNFFDELKEFITGALPKMAITTVHRMSEGLIDKGVESLQDLEFVTADNLNTFGLKEIHINKLLSAFSSQNKENVVPKTASKTSQQSKKAKTPLLREEIPEVESIASRPKLAEKVTETGVLNYSIVWGNMRDTLLISLEKGERPKPTDRENMIFEISKEVKMVYQKIREENPTIKQKTPGRKVYNALTRAIFLDFKDSFEDVLAGKVVGDGMFSLQNQFETCMENMFRTRVPGNERTAPVKGNRSAACILPDMFAPSLTKAQKIKAEENRLQLAALYKSGSSWDWKSVNEKMNDQCSLGAQRSLINVKKRDFNVIMDQWPFLFEFCGLVSHLEKITGLSSLLGNFESFVQQDLQDYIYFLTIQSPKRIVNLKVKNASASANGLHQSIMGLIEMVCNHFGEDFSLILQCAEEGTLPSEVPEMDNLPLTPCILAIGVSYFEAKEYFICMNGLCINHGITNCVEAVMALTASYFVFGILYPNNVSNTLTFNERLIANLSDSSGVVKASTSKGNPANSVLRKLTTLVQEKDEFVREFNGST